MELVHVCVLRDESWTWPRQAPEGPFLNIMQKLKAQALRQHYELAASELDVYLLSVRIAQDIAAHDVDQVWLWIHFTHKPAQSFPKPACTPQTHKQIPLMIVLSLKEYCDRNKSVNLTNWLMSSSFTTLAKVATLFFSRYRCPGPPWDRKWHIWNLT